MPNSFSRRFGTAHRSKSYEFIDCILKPRGTQATGLIEQKSSPFKKNDAVNIKKIQNKLFIFLLLVKLVYYIFLITLVVPARSSASSLVLVASRLSVCFRSPMTLLNRDIDSRTVTRDPRHGEKVTLTYGGGARAKHHGPAAGRHFIRVCRRHCQKTNRQNDRIGLVSRYSAIVGMAAIFFTCNRTAVGTDAANSSCAASSCVAAIAGSTTSWNK